MSVHFIILCLVWINLYYKYAERLLKGRKQFSQRLIVSVAISKLGTTDLNQELKETVSIAVITCSNKDYCQTFAVYCTVTSCFSRTEPTHRSRYTVAYAVVSCAIVACKNCMQQLHMKPRLRLCNNFSTMQELHAIITHETVLLHALPCARVHWTGKVASK